MSTGPSRGAFVNPATTPAFGQADLSNCEREQIHFAGSIQPHGALLLLREPDLVVVQASANAVEYLHLGDGALGQRLDELPGDLGVSVQPILGEPLHAESMLVRCRIGDPAVECDGLLHRPPGGGLVIELERAGPTVDLYERVDDALQTVLTAGSLPALCDATTRLIRDFTGYDRVMVYRFDDLGHGEIFAESKEPELEPFLGNRYPASDIPQMARRLYLQNRVRILVDVDYAPVPLQPRLSPITGQDLDMSLCTLRSMSPIHVQYLQNMGVAATLVVSLVVGGRLWGLIACHHGQPHVVHYELRAVCDLLAENVATRIAALESFARTQAELSVRRLEQRMIEAVSREGDWRGALFDNPQSLLQPLEASGAALLFEGQILTAGEVPGTHDLRDIAAWLDAQSLDPVLATASLGLVHPIFAPLIAVACGLIATPVSTAPGEYLIWFRPERVRTVTWGGNPFKPVLVGDDPRDLSPRRSFTKWHQLVEGTCEPWTPADLFAARQIGATVGDVILQFRSVRMLIAQDQLDQVSTQVRLSENPVVIADPRGRILLTNEAFERLLPAHHIHLHWLDDLAVLFTEAAEVRHRLDELIRHRRTWRDEVRLESKLGDARPVLVRADPVQNAPDRVLGFVLTFSDLFERKVAAAARRRFQEGLVERRQTMPARRPHSTADLPYRQILSTVVGNAELAALEITEGVDVAQIPEMLESVRTAVARVEDLLDHLLRHGSPRRDPPD